jgi:hypothetical protein
MSYVDNTNNPNYVPQYVTWRGHTHHNTSGMNQQEITERIMRREVGSRVDPDGRLMAQHVMQINTMRANGANQRSGMSMTTQASQTMQNQHVNAIRELMAQEEEGSLRMNVLQQMLESATRPPVNDTTRTVQWLA